MLMVIGFCVWFVFHTLLITLSGLHNSQHIADVAVVLGNEVNFDGRPSDRLKARLDMAIELFDKGLVSNFIVSGGMGKEGYDEAKVMASYLVEKGVSSKSIFLDSEGINTEATANNSVKIMSANNWKSVIIVSQYFHIARVKLAFEKKGVKELYSASPSYFELRDFYSIFREFFAYYAYAVNV
ncbi:YdcF family protein [Candidatus Peregrinibacteria bacterium]|nr:YdcF family protein [Candidatus Peregrinibacteria bacterium]